MSGYPSQPQTNEKDPNNEMNPKLKGTLNKEMEMKLLSEEVRNEICPKSKDKSLHEFVHEYNKSTLFFMVLGLPIFFNVKKVIKCKHCNKKFATYAPTI